MGSVAKFYLDEDTADVQFTFGSNYDGTSTQIKAHKILLAAGSDVFKAMFYGKLKESDEIHITDVSDTAFKEFMQYFYKNKLKLTTENIVEVMYLGNKYNVPKCVEDCAEILKRTLTDENICAGLLMGILYDQTELLKLCEKHIISYTEAIFKTAGFLDCDRSVLKHILSMEVFSCSEVDVFDACMDWVKVKSNFDALTKEIVQEYLGDLYYKIRFASLTMHQLCALQTKYDSVISSDFIDITKIIIIEPGFQSDKFITNPRQIKWNTDAIVKCDRVARFCQNAFFRCVDYENEMKFSTNEPLLLGSFLCTGRIVMGNLCDKEFDRNYTVDVTIMEQLLTDDTNTKVLLSNMKIRSTQTNILLPQPILIRPGFLYSIHIGPFSRRHIFPGRMVKCEIQLESGAIIKFHNEHVNGDADAKGGLIFELEFNKI